MKRVMKRAILVLLVMLVVDGAVNAVVKSRHDDTVAWPELAEAWASEFIPETSELQFSIIDAGRADTVTAMELLADQEHTRILGCYVDGNRINDGDLVFATNMDVTAETYVRRPGEARWRKFLVVAAGSSVEMRTVYYYKATSKDSFIFILTPADMDDSTKITSNGVLIGPLEDGYRPFRLGATIGLPDCEIEYRLNGTADADSLYLSTIGSNGIGSDAHVLLLASKLSPWTLTTIGLLVLRFALFWVMVGSLEKIWHRHRERKVQQTS